jgi:hypothetical protein
MIVLQCSTGLQAAHRLDQLQPRPDRPLSIVLVPVRIAELYEHSIAQITVQRYLVPAAAGGFVWWLGYYGMHHREAQSAVWACITVAACAVFLFVYYLG